MPTRGSKEPNGRALRGRRAHTTFYQLLGGGAGVNPFWLAFNQRADADGALPAEAAVNGCLQTRFLNSFQSYDFFVFYSNFWLPFMERANTDSADAAEVRFINCLEVRMYNLLNA
jgi:hypothetical protein